MTSPPTGFVWPQRCLSRATWGTVPPDNLLLTIFPSLLYGARRHLAELWIERKMLASRVESYEKVLKARVQNHCHRRTLISWQKRSTTTVHKNASHISTTDRKTLIPQLLFQSRLVSFPTRWYLYWPPISRLYTFTNWTRYLGAFDLLWTLWLSHLSSWPITPTQALRHWDKRYSSTLNVLIAIRQTFCQVKDTSCSDIFWINTEFFSSAQSIGYLRHNLKQRFILYISKLVKLNKKGERKIFIFC